MDYTYRLHTKYIEYNDICIELQNYIENNNDIIPQNIIHLKFGNNYNGIVNKLHCGLLTIWFGFNFNKSIDNLPESIQTLIIGEKFNQPISKLPLSLLYFTLKNKHFVFNIPLSNNVYMINDKNQILNLLKYFSNEINIITMENYNNNYKNKFKNIIDIKEINIPNNLTHLIDSEFQHLIKYIV